MKKFLIAEDLLNIVKAVLKSGVLKCTLEEGSQLLNALHQLVEAPADKAPVSAEAAPKA